MGRGSGKLAPFMAPFMAPLRGVPARMGSQEPLPHQQIRQQKVLDRQTMVGGVSPSPSSWPAMRRDYSILGDPCRCCRLVYSCTVAGHLTPKLLSWGMGICARSCNAHPQVQCSKILATDLYRKASSGCCERKSAYTGLSLASHTFPDFFSTPSPEA